MVEEINSKEENKITIKERLKKINKVITGDVLANLAYSTMIIIYFLFFDINYNNLTSHILKLYINISSMVFLALSILMMEIAYKKEKDNIIIYGLEFLALAIYVLLIKHVPQVIGWSVQKYILMGSYLFIAYYILKSAILYTIEKKKKLNELSDIKEIVKDEPIKKASKRKNKKEEGAKNND